MRFYEGWYTSERALMEEIIDSICKYCFSPTAGKITLLFRYN